MTTSVLLLVAFLLLLVVLASSAVFIVRTQEAAVIERLGKFHRVAQAGLNFKIPLIERVRTELNLQVIQQEVRVETKTKDNVFVMIPVAVQYKVADGRAREAAYLLSSPQEQIVSYVQDNVRSSLANMNLDESFSSKDDIARNVETVLSERMGSYGWHIVNTLVTDIRPDEQVRASMNSINASQREREAAIYLAEADKVKLVKQAEADAEAKRLQGEGVAAQRKAIADGLAEQVSTLKESGVAGQAEQLILLTQYFDAIQATANSSNSTVLFMPSNPGGLTDMSSQIQQAMIAANATNGPDSQPNASA